MSNGPLAKQLDNLYHAWNGGSGFGVWVTDMMDLDPIRMLMSRYYGDARAGTDDQIERALAAAFKGGDR